LIDEITFLEEERKLEGGVVVIDDANIRQHARVCQYQKEEKRRIIGF